jgi:hypothetical protein
LGEVAAESGEDALMVLVGDMARRTFFLLLSWGDVAACEEVCARRGEEDLWQLLVVWAGELGHPEVNFFYEYFWQLLWMLVGGYLNPEFVFCVFCCICILGILMSIFLFFN